MVSQIVVIVRKVGIPPQTVTLPLGSSYQDAIDIANEVSDGQFVVKATQEVRFGATVITDLDDEITERNGMISINNKTASGR